MMNPDPKRGIAPVVIPQYQYGQTLPSPQLMSYPSYTNTHQAFPQQFTPNGVHPMYSMHMSQPMMPMMQPVMMPVYPQQFTPGGVHPMYSMVSPQGMMSPQGLISPGVNQMYSVPPSTPSGVAPAVNIAPNVFGSIDALSELARPPPVPISNPVVRTTSNSILAMKHARSNSSLQSPNVVNVPPAPTTATENWDFSPSAPNPTPATSLAPSISPATSLAPPLAHLRATSDSIGTPAVPFNTPANADFFDAFASMPTPSRTYPPKIIEDPFGASAPFSVPDHRSKPITSSKSVASDPFAFPDFEDKVDKPAMARKSSATEKPRKSSIKEEPVFARKLSNSERVKPRTDDGTPTYTRAKSLSKTKKSAEFDEADDPFAKVKSKTNRKESVDSELEKDPFVDFGGSESSDEKEDTVKSRMGSLKNSSAKKETKESKKEAEKPKKMESLRSASPNTSRFSKKLQSKAASSEEEDDSKEVSKTSRRASKKIQISDDEEEVESRSRSKSKQSKSGGKLSKKKKINGLEHLKNGITLLKFGRSGAPHFRELFLTSNNDKLVFYSSGKSEDDTTIPMEDVNEVVLGFQKNNSSFDREKHDKVSHLAFSIVYSDKDKPKLDRTLDFVCCSRFDLKILENTIRHLIRTPRSERPAMDEYIVSYIFDKECVDGGEDDMDYDESVSENVFSLVNIIRGNSNPFEHTRSSMEKLLEQSSKLVQKTKDALQSKNKLFGALNSRLRKIIVRLNNASDFIRSEDYSVAYEHILAQQYELEGLYQVVSHPATNK